MKEIFLESCRSCLDNYLVKYSGDRAGVFYPAGKNGPYFDIESPVRNSSHWLVSFSVAYNLTGDNQFLEIAEKLISFLVDNQAYSFEEVAIHRQKEHKDWSNGVIGPAWHAEGLLFAGKILNNEKAKNKAIGILKSHCFDEEKGLWRIVDPVRGDQGFDLTYNHQAWFASVAAESGDKELLRSAKLFLDKSDSLYFGCDENGVVRHLVPGVKKDSPMSFIQKLAKKFSYKAKRLHITHEDERDVGYQLYDLYALARLKKCLPDHSFWKNENLDRSIRLAGEESFLSRLYSNKYSYPYNAPGFEYPLISYVFSDLEAKLSEMCDQSFAIQVEKTWSNSTNMFDRNTYDPMTLSSRIYELAIFLLFKVENVAKG